MLTTDKKTGILLAGGKSTRMGSDKGLLQLNGKPMATYGLNTLTAVCQNIIISTNQPEYNQFGFDLVADEIADKGPLAGVVKGLTVSQTAHNFVLSCDTPYVSVDLFNHLWNHRGDASIVIPVHNNQPHYLIGYYHHRILPHLQEQLTLNNVKMQRVIKGLNVKQINCDQFDAREFKNLNQPTDL